MIFALPWSTYSQGDVSNVFFMPMKHTPLSDHLFYYSQATVSKTTQVLITWRKGRTRYRGEYQRTDRLERSKENDWRISLKKEACNIPFLMLFVPVGDLLGNEQRSLSIVSRRRWLRQRLRMTADDMKTSIMTNQLDAQIILLHPLAPTPGIKKNDMIFVSSLYKSLLPFLSMCTGMSSQLGSFTFYLPSHQQFLLF